jgi:hypothetical protein
MSENVNDVPTRFRTGGGDGQFGLYGVSGGYSPVIVYLGKNHILDAFHVYVFHKFDHK